MKELNSENFDVVLSGNQAVVVDFWAPWCGPCRALGPVFEQVAEEADSGVVIAKVNIDEDSEIAERFGIQSIPTIIFFKNGAEVKRSTGMTTKADILANIASL